MQILKVLLPLLALIISTASLPSNPITPPQSLSDPGGPCQSDSNCYGGANCCFSICTLGSCHAPANNAGAACLKDSNCFGGAKCCNSVCTLGSCRMDGTCDENRDCYGWCHNNPGTCKVEKGKKEGTCSCK